MSCFNIPQGENAALEPIAICGMSCRLPGGIKSPSDLWKALISKRVANSAKVPKSRFNIDAHLHKDSERPGSFNVPGGYFLDETPECFDPTFFNMTPIEAMWLDPQQRRILEAAFEAIESAGLAIEDISGTNVGVWVGSFTADYQQMNFKDPDFRHSYSATGVDTGIISNRINNLFDLKGPSSTINTACSSSVYALHNACNALRARDCDAALVCGVNLILTVDQHMNTAKLGVLSPTNTCHTFDAVADGYGRGEGAGALYIKRLTDALQDGDTIRAVIRSSAVNTNGKVPGYGITFPNALGQEAVVRAAYKRGGLDPNKTAYFECHGTGTPVGDPVEARAASRAMNDTRDPNKPLLIGAVKPNVGHSEAASGIFAVIKAALMVEKGLIPGVAGLQTVNPEIPEAELGLKINRDLISWPTEFESRRASVSSFGYGGTNGHVILENVEALVPNYHHGREKTPSDNPAATRPLLLTVSAHDQITLERNIRANLAVAENYSLLDLAYTLNMRRSKLPQRAFAIATEDGSIPLEEGAFVFGTGKKAVKNLAFVFTGQGAQWASVGTEAIKVFPVFRDTIRRLDNVLRKVEHPPTFSIEEQLTAPAEVSKINDPNIAQPTLVAVQIAIVDLLASWGVYPTAVIGHSAGEHAASYAAGLYSAPETIISGYYRGFCLERHAPSGGSMLAVGKGASEVGVDLEQLPSDLVLACENSSKSVTLSGPAETIHAAEAFFKEKGVFARELRTGMAYHSSHMQSTADHMAHYIDAGVQRLDDVDLRWRQPRSVMVSTVTNKELTPEDIKGAYWASNLRSRVLFDTGLATLLKLTTIGEIQGLLEVGPHSALGGPIKQILETSGSSEVAYFSTVVRTEGNSALSLLRSAGRLFNSQYPVNLSAMNGTETPSSPDEVAILKAAQVLKPQPLVDLPPYQWNYEKTFWAEPRLSAEYRQLTHPRHDILGRRILGLSDNSISWRNILRLRDVPWLADHKLGGSIMFPAAGHMAVAIEALRQRMELSGTAVAGVTLRNVELTKALVIPEGDVGVEIQVRLISTSRAEEGNTFDFAVESYTDGVWVVHSTGVVAPMAEGHIAPTSAAINPVNTKNLTRLQTGRVWNDTFTRVGFEYRGSFAALDCVRTHEQHAPQAMGQIPIMTASGVMEDESRYIIHPAAVDAVLQLVIIAIHQGLYQEMPWGVIPVRFEEVDFYFPSESEAGSKGLSTAWLPSRGPRDRKFVSNAILESEAGNILLHIKGLHTVAYDAALPPKAEDALAPMPYFGNTWNADYTLSSLDDIFSRELKDGSVTRALPGLVQIINHKTPVDSVLLVHSSAPIVSDILVHLGIASSITIGTSDVIPAELEALVNLHSLKTVKVPEDASELASLGLSELNLAVIAGEQSKKLIQKEWLAKFKDTLAAGGKAILVVDHGDLSGARSKIHQAGFVGQEVSFVDKTLMLLSVPAVYTNGHAPPRVTLAYSALHSPRPDALLAQLREQYEGIEVKTLEELDVANSDKVIIYNPTGNLLTRAEQSSFDALKRCLLNVRTLLWLTRGINEGRCPEAATATGLLRTLSEEQKQSRVLTLDADVDEPGDVVARSIVAVLEAKKPEGFQADEREYWLHNHVCYINRLVPNESLNLKFAAPDAALSKEEPLPRGLILEGHFESGHVQFEQQDLSDAHALVADELLVQVQDSELFKSDLLTVPGEPRLALGTVISGAENWLGKTVATWTTNPFKTVLKVAQNTSVQMESGEMRTLLPILSGLCRAMNALSPLDELPGKSVLLVEAPDEMARLVVALSSVYKFTVAIAGPSEDTAATIEKLDVNDLASLQNYTHQAGASLVILTDHFSSTCQSLWSQIPAGALFVLAEPKRGVPRALDSAPFNRGAKFQVTEVAASLSFRPAKLSQLLSAAIPIAGNLGMKQDQPSLTLPELQGDKIPEQGAVLSYQYEVDPARVTPLPYKLRFSSEDVYLLVGCLGGLGRSLVSWMIGRGARHFAFMSRSGADKPEAARVIEDITQAGAFPQVYRVDAGSLPDVAATVKTIVDAGQKIRGVVHAAMVLNDSMISKVTLEKWTRTLAPKMIGAQVLGQVLSDAGQDDHLDFFVMTSSISTVVGNLGQSNYVAANMFLDSFAWQRNKNGQVGSAVSLPMVLDVGVVAENPQLEGKIARRGLYGVGEREMLRGFEAAMSMPRPGQNKPATPLDSVVVMGLDPLRIAAAIAAAAAAKSRYVTWLDDARFAVLRQYINIAEGHGGAGGSNGGATGFAEQIATIAAEKGYTEALDKTAIYLMQKCATILLLPFETFKPNGPSIGDYGLDSMIGMEMRTWLFKDLGLNIAFQELLAVTMNFNNLAALVLAERGINP